MALHPGLCEFLVQERGALGIITSTPDGRYPQLVIAREGVTSAWMRASVYHVERKTCRWLVDCYGAAVSAYIDVVMAFLL